jgi:hypothetical protein
MAEINGPKIVTSGLIVALDAADKSSYPGSGTTWYDISGNNNNGTLVNGPTYTTVNGGAFLMDGSNDYIIVSTPNMSATNYTVMGIARYVSSAAGRIFSGRGNNWLMGWWAGYTENYYAEGWVTGPTYTAYGDLNWKVLAATGNIFTDTYSLYINGTNTATSSGGSQGPIGFNLGTSDGVNEFSNSYISVLLVYNRVLSAAEIQQNYNAQKGRFGLS